MAGRAWPRDLLAGSAIGVGYWLAVMGGLRWALLPGAGTPVWPAAGIAFAGLVLGGSRLWPAVLVARFAASLAVGTPQPAWADLLVAAATTFGAWLPVRLLETGRRLDPRLGSMRDMLWVTVGGGVLGAVISATLGVAALWLGGIALARVPYAWLNWAFGYFVGILTLGPLVLAWSAPGAFQMKPRRWFHLAACLLSVALVSAVVFLRPDDSFLRTWHILPTLVWAALAFQVRGVAAALAIASAAAIFAAVAGTGPLATQPGQEIGRVLLTQQFLAMTGLTMLFLAAVADERRNVEALGRLAAIVSSSPEAMMSLDRRRRFTSWNRGAEILFGWSAADVIGRGPELIVPPFELGARSALSRVLEGETVEEETVRVAKDGTLIDVVVTGAPVYAPDGTIIGAASVIRDVRAAKRAEDALQRLNETLEQRVAERTRDLEQANASLAAEIKAREDAEARIRQMEKMEAIGQLTGGIAHDFNNMLSVVIGSLDIVRRRAKGLEPKHAQLIDNALDGANRAARLTERLLAFSRRQPLS
ncbi:MAG: MASE1 domain-containing protein, partial [Methylobacteriaceae bacterium]|nr:MASE1 domain-containing protein [Methylobacteriaceae bacterium]